MNWLPDGLSDASLVLLIGQKTRRVGAVTFALGAIVFVCACDRQEGWPNDAVSAAIPEAQVSAEVRRAAAALSVASWTVPEGQSEYARSVECAGALQAVVGALQGTTLIGASELQQLRQAGELFESRAQDQADEEGQARDQVRSNLTDARTKAGTNLGQSLRVAIACARILADPA